ncbi:hypothetical protein F4779DRAFT_245206 [Xylariaceae sp. FL0662B]|nr:hypothetical protein F4779DRAFT_245206 [Xylariaceae sp. FL0662B]
MAEPHVTTPTSRSTIRRPLRSTSQSPARHQRLGDDLLSRLSPTSAVEALRHPTGALKTCIDQASASEQAFAMRTAVASKNIHEWLDELSDWPWPSTSGSAGFELPPAKRRKLPELETPGDNNKGKSAETAPQDDTQYYGSLPAADVARYEKRIEQIQQDMDDLDLEEIKSQVLHNHIMPLSRPGTPFSEAGRPTGSIFAFAKMGDISAVVTAITVQALPNLSRLSRLLNIWSVRLNVLHKVPRLLTMITDAEVALRSGWSAIESMNRGPAGAGVSRDKAGVRPPILSKNDFDVMSRIIQQKVTKPGRDLDYMLDSLEGMADTLPDEWLDRMEKIERDYAEWITIADQKVREGERSTLTQAVRRPESREEPETPQPKIHVQGPSPTRGSLESTDQSVFPPTPFDGSAVESETARDRNSSSRKPSAERLDDSSPQGVFKILIDEPSSDIPKSTSQVIDVAKNAARQYEVDSGAVVKNPSLEYDDTDKKRPTNGPNSPTDSPHLPPPGKARKQSYDGSEDKESSEDGESSPVLSEVDRNVVRNPSQGPKRHNAVVQRESLLEDSSESPVMEPSILEPVDEEDEELELPPMRPLAHKDSRLSVASTVIRGPTGSFLDVYETGPSREGSIEPELPRLPDPDEPFSSDAISPPSSPPLRYKARSTSVTFKEAPEIAMLPEKDNTPPRSPLEPPVVFDPDTSFDYDSQFGSPSRMSMISTTSEDEHLQQQISELLESIPAKIRLTKASKINLNPPDFQLPPRPKSRASEPTRRSGSSLSSRAGTPGTYSRSGTPSFMLAPAREHRAKSKTSQDIRVYHLSRSTGEPPIKLFIRCVGEHGERVMVRVGGGWADLGEYLRDYAIHHSRRSKGEGRVEIQDVPVGSTSRIGSSPSSRPGSAADTPMTPLAVRKTRMSLSEEGPPRFPKTPLVYGRPDSDTPSSDASARSRGSSYTEWNEEDSALGLAGPKAKKVEISDESRAWVESVKEKVRIASGERIAGPDQRIDNKFGEMGKVGGTKRLFRKN